MMKIKIFFKECISDPRLSTPLVLALFLNAIIWGLSAWRLKASGSWLILHYNVYFGIDWISQQNFEVFYYPLGALLITLLNFLAGTLILSGGLKRWLLWTSVLAQFLVLLNVIMIVINYAS